MSSSTHAQTTQAQMQHTSIISSSRPSIAEAAQIALRGPSAEVVTEFFHFCVNSILYQRGPLLYPPESYRRVSKYGLTMHLTTDPALISYMSTVTKQLEEWLNRGAAQKLVLAIKGLESDVTLERWVFDCDCSSSTTTASSSKLPQKDVTLDIAHIMRQITSSMTFLPVLTEPCSFDILIYTNRNADVPKAWEASDPCYVHNCDDFKMRSFHNNVHSVDVSVFYKGNESF